MIITIIGLLHLIHTPLLVLFPFIVNNFTTDIFYIIYFFSIMFFYTFIDGECPISYICKVMMDKKEELKSITDQIKELESEL
jgi:hypothetical protein